MAGFCPFTRSDIGFSSVQTPQTFLTLSLQDMASRVQLSGPQEAEKYVLHMVSSPERPKHKKCNPVDADRNHDIQLYVFVKWFDIFFSCRCITQVFYLLCWTVLDLKALTTI